MRDAIVDLHIYPRGVREPGVGVSAGPPNAITMRGERPDKCKELLAFAAALKSTLHGR